MIDHAALSDDAPDPGEQHSERLGALIREQIEAAGGALPFDRFMDLALYAPGLGYYAAGAAKLGAQGDFVTAPELSPLFGRCVATQCAEVLSALSGGDILEFGAGTGALAAELLNTLADLGQSPGRYLILEPSPDLAERQRRLLAERAPEQLARVHWVAEPPTDLRGLILANEVLDAMPVHRFCLRGRQIDEVLVQWTDQGPRELRAAPVSAGLTEAVAALGLPAMLGTDRESGADTDARSGDGYCSEVNLRLGPWFRMLSDHLSAGMVLMIDYGYPRREYYLPERRGGTLMCYHRHRAHADPYANLGLQDITAHVDFTAVAEAGTAAGLELAGYTTQANFLLGCGLDRHLQIACTRPEDMLGLAAAAKQLVLPSAMGERFQVLALSRELEPPADEWCGFARRDLRARLG